MSVIRAFCDVGPNGRTCDGSVETGSVAFLILFLTNSQNIFSPGIVSGVITFEQEEGANVKIQYRVTGLTAGLHGFHM